MHAQVFKVHAPDISRAWHEVVLVVASSNLRRPGDIYSHARSGQQALPVRLLCALPLRAREHGDLLDNSWSVLLARQESCEEGESCKGPQPSAPCARPPSSPRESYEGAR